jgi:GGDEF domain-containing protein
MENDTNSSDTLKSEVNELKKEIDIYKQRVNELIEEIEEHKHYLTINPKTGLPNHKVFVKDLQKLMEERNTGSSQLFAIIS